MRTGKIKGGKKDSAQEPGVRAHTTLYLPDPFLYSSFSLELTALFTHSSPRTIPRLMPESLESLRELHYDFRDKNCIHENRLEPCLAYCQHSIHMGYSYCYCCYAYYYCSREHPNMCNRSYKAISCLGCQMHTQVTNDSNACFF